MKRQYLGDSRDSFKWDLLHWLCTRAEPRFRCLVFVPLLTPDDLHSREGRTASTLFQTRPVVREFVEKLRGHPAGMSAIREFGCLEPERPFEVSVFKHEAYVPEDNRRGVYWEGLDAMVLGNSIVFLDPDIGFASDRQHGDKWVSQKEVQDLLSSLPDDSAVAVFQYRPRLTPWSSLLKKLRAETDYAHFAFAVYHGSLAFVLLASGAKTAERIGTAASQYASQNAKVSFEELRAGAV